MNLSFPQMPEKLTSTEQDIVEYIAAHRDEFLCMTIGQLSAALHISEATVSRFARHVGCEDFKHLKRTVVEQTIQRGPVQKLSNTLQAKEDDILAAWLEQQAYDALKDDGNIRDISVNVTLQRAVAGSERDTAGVTDADEVWAYVTLENRYTDAQSFAESCRAMSS